MQGGEKLSLDKIRALMAASEELRFTGHSRKDIYAWVETTMREQGYRKQSREGKGLLRSYIAKMTGLSRAQVTRLIAKYSATGAVKPALYGRHRFTVRYTRRDAELLAMVDEAHQTVALGNLILRCSRAEYTVFERAALDVTRPASSADNASFRDANRLTGAAPVTVNRAAQGHRPMRMESHRRCLYAARRS